MNETTTEQTNQEIKKLYSSPTLSEIGKVNDKTKGSAIDGNFVDSGCYVNQPGCFIS